MLQIQVLTRPCCIALPAFRSHHLKDPAFKLQTNNCFRCVVSCQALHCDFTWLWRSQCRNLQSGARDLKSWMPSAALKTRLNRERPVLLRNLYWSVFESYSLRVHSPDSNPEVSPSTQCRCQLKEGLTGSSTFATLFRATFYGPTVSSGLD